MVPGLQINQSNERHFGRWIILLLVTIALAALGYFGLQWYTKGEIPPVVPLPAQAKADPSIDETDITSAQIDSHSVPPDTPRYVSIPSLGITKARVVTVGLTADNLLDTPKNINDTAWFDKSAKPGSGRGAVVIDGHNGGMTKNGVFVKLSELKQGDEIILERGDGQKISYLVETNETMSLTEANTTGMQNMMKSIDPSREGLSLITCAGNWVPRDKIFDKRVMVRAVADV